MECRARVARRFGGVVVNATLALASFSLVSCYETFDRYTNNYVIQCGEERITLHLVGQTSERKNEIRFMEVNGDFVRQKENYDESIDEYVAEVDVFQLGPNVRIPDENQKVVRTFVLKRKGNPLIMSPLTPEEQAANNAPFVRYDSLDDPSGTPCETSYKQIVERISL